MFRDIYLIIRRKNMIRMSLSAESLRKIDALILHDEYLRNNKKLQQKIITLIQEVLEDVKSESEELRATIVDAFIMEYKRTQAKKCGKIRDNKYAPFREYFKDLQKKIFIKAKENGKCLSANAFVYWFLENKPEDVIIPYKISNQQHKLLRLAQENNREFRKYP